MAVSQTGQNGVTAPRNVELGAEIGHVTVTALSHNMGDKIVMVVEVRKNFAIPITAQVCYFLSSEYFKQISKQLSYHDFQTLIIRSFTM